VTSDTNNGSGREILRERFARGEIDAEEYDRSLGVLETERGANNRRRFKPKLLAVGLAAAALLAVGGGVAFAANQSESANERVDAGRANSGETGSDGMGSMMDGGGMGSMMNGNGKSSMMDEGGMDSMMGSFDKDEPFDLQFIDQMTMHHEGAIMSSEHMISDSKRPELRKLAENIEQSQSEQIERMQGFRKDWYSDAKRTSGMPAGMMDEMMSGGQMEKMMGGSMREMMGGDTTDEMFLEMMIPHHQMAVDMAEKALKEAKHPELKELARKIKDEQTAEIELMEGYLVEIEAADSI